jgi:NitT/TauT family transport system substrate-binding protein
MKIKIKTLPAAARRRNVIIVAAAFCVAAFCVASWNATAQAQDVVRVAVGVDPSFTSWWVAADKGFFAKQNLKVEITQFSGGPDLADATMAGEQDFGSSGTATWMPRFVRSDSLRILCTMATSPNNFKMAALASITSLADLKGKRVGTVSGSSTDYLWALVAKKLAIPENGLDIVGVTPPELVPALVRGDVEAFFSWEPWPSKAVEVAGKDRVHILASSGDVGYFQSFVVVGNRHFIEAKPDVTVRVLAALRDATDYLNKEHADTIKIAAARNKMTAEMADYILSLYKFKLDIADSMLEGARTEETWMRGKERLRGGPIDWSIVIDRKYFDRAMLMR